MFAKVKKKKVSYARLIITATDKVRVKLDEFVNASESRKVGIFNILVNCKRKFDCGATNDSSSKLYSFLPNLSFLIFSHEFLLKGVMNSELSPFIS